MKRLSLIIVLLVMSFQASAQAFESDKGGYYFFSPTKHGFIGLSTVAMNMGVGEYMSSGTTIVAYNKQGEKQSTSGVDCRDAYNYGLSNEKNDFSYLVSTFINDKNSFYKLILYRIDNNAGVGRVTINIKSRFREVIGSGKYLLDLKYTLATENAMVFVFGKYLDGVEEFFLVKVANDDQLSIIKLDFQVDDKLHQLQQVSDLKYVFDSKYTLSIIQMTQKDTDDVKLKVKHYSVIELKEVESKLYNLNFIGSDFFLCRSNLKPIKKTYEQRTPSVIQRNWSSIDAYSDFEFIYGKLSIIGFYYNNNFEAGIGKRADGLFMTSLSSKLNINTLSDDITFKYLDKGSPTPEFTYVIDGSGFLPTFWFKKENRVSLYASKKESNEISLKNGDATSQLVNYLDIKNLIPEKNLKFKKSNLFRTIDSYYCMHGVKSNSVGFHSKFSIAKF